MSAKEDQDGQLEDVDEADIQDEDILLGRGGKTNYHIGNGRYLKIIEARQVHYMFIKSRTEKTEYAMNIVREFRLEGLRFLKKDMRSKLWNDVGDTNMRKKVSQNLREHQPKLKEQQLWVDGRVGRGVPPQANNAFSQAQAHLPPGNQQEPLSPGQMQYAGQDEAQGPMPSHGLPFLQAPMQQPTQQMREFAQQQQLPMQQLQHMSSSRGSPDIFRAENELLSSVGADNHQLASLSMLSEMSEMTDNTLTLEEEKVLKGSK